GIDDGPETIEGSLALARAARAAGIETIVATPHVSRAYPNEAATIGRLVEEMEARFAAEGLSLGLRSGAEIAIGMVDGIAPEELSELALGDGPWLLIECPFTSLASGVDLLLLRLQSKGHKVVLAHPERSPFFHRETKLLGSLVKSGVLTSITAGSLTGRFGKQVQRFGRSLLEEGLVHNVASDAHDSSNRPPGIRAELQDSGFGDLVDWLAQEVPSAILAGEAIPKRPGAVPAGRKPGVWWRRER
ncbi:MAG TPA: CpsB/CapC family capsule biosynthesis tyrosine phosphatase, partial [Solirubrobacteraceae bacterium]|nr:CpsB/CapC family capsule biosynthesis tyrosine phosphatase [Solirubrobacteraceae bacterium]